MADRLDFSDRVESGSGHMVKHGWFDFRGTALSLSRGLTDYHMVRRVISVLVRGNHLQQLLLRTRGKQFLNAGCGTSVPPEFVNVDYHWCPGVDLCWDLRRPLPLRAASFDGIYSEHCLEHIAYDDAVALLKQFKRLLRPGGIVRLVVPDAELYLKLYARSQAGEKVSFPYEPNPPPPHFTALQAVNRIFRNHGHQFAYDEKTLAESLLQAGFRDPRRRSYMSGDEPKLLIDSEWRAVESLYMEATA
jgi:predicted SAM-dependent methyltransferase